MVFVKMSLRIICNCFVIPHTNAWVCILSNIIFNVHMFKVSSLYANYKMEKGERVRPSEKRSLTFLKNEKLHYCSECKKKREDMEQGNLTTKMKTHPASVSFPLLLPSHRLERKLTIPRWRNSETALHQSKDLISFTTERASQ